LIGDTSPLFALARRTYEHRPYPVNQDWSCDPIQAARLKLGSEVSKTLIKLAETYQTFVNGFANWGGTAGEFYVEQGGVDSNGASGSAGAGLRWHNSHCASHSVQLGLRRQRVRARQN